LSLLLGQELSVVDGRVAFMTDTMLPSLPASPGAVLGAVTEAVADLDQTMWAARGAGELLGTIQSLERLRSVLDAVELQLVAEVDATQAARAEGWASTKDYLTAVTGGRRGEGRRMLSLAKAVTTDRVATGAALASGCISRAQAEVVVAVVDRLPGAPGLRNAAEDLLLADARTHDATDLAKRGGYVLERLDPDGTERRDERALEREERAAHTGRFLSLAEDGIGGVLLKGRGTVEDAADLKAVLFALAAPRPPAEPGVCGGTPGAATSCGITDCAHDGRDPREHGTRMWDALIEASRLLAATDVLPTSHGARPRIGVHIDLAALRSGLGTGLLDGGETLSAVAVRRLACDAEILPLVLGSRSQLLDVGRSSRLVTPVLWVALVARDRQCSFPGCTRPPVACDAHHIVHWVDGGGTSLSNLVLLCRAHHTTIHHTPWEVRLSSEDQRPEFLPPARLNPDRRPLRRRALRT